MTGLMREMTGLEKLRELAEAIKQDADNRRIELCSSLGIDLETGWADAMAAMRRRLMPEGMEWPVFEDGEPVRIGDVAVLADNEPHEVESMEFFADKSCKLKGKGTPWMNTIFKGQIAKRPAPEALDADGVEIRVGDTVCGTRDMEPMRVVDTDSRECGFKHIKCEKEGDGFWFYCPDELTHKLPVIAADGKPLREGETVYVCVDYPYSADIVTGEAVSVRSAYGSNDAEVMDRKGYVWFVDANQLTHKPFDSWERIEEDKGLNPFDYCKKVGHKLWTFDNAEEFKASDLVRRCRALAERERSE